MLFPPSGYIFPPCIQSPEKSLMESLPPKTLASGSLRIARVAQTVSQRSQFLELRQHFTTLSDMQSLYTVWFCYCICLGPNKNCYEILLYFCLRIETAAGPVSGFHSTASNQSIELPQSFYGRVNPSNQGRSQTLDCEKIFENIRKFVISSQ